MGWWLSFAVIILRVQFLTSDVQDMHVVCPIIRGVCWLFYQVVRELAFIFRSLSSLYHEFRSSEAQDTILLKKSSEKRWVSLDPRWDQLETKWCLAGTGQRRWFLWNPIYFLGWSHAWNPDKIESVS